MDKPPFDGPGIASEREACPIKQPLTAESLHALVQHLAATMEHNFMPSLMVLGSCAMALHYHTVLGKFLFCPIPLAFGESGTWKTAALRCELAITGVYPSRFYSRASLEKYSELCSASYLPQGIEDPKLKPAISDLTIAVLNGAKGTTIKRGEVHHLQWQLFPQTSQPQSKRSKTIYSPGD